MCMNIEAPTLMSFSTNTGKVHLKMEVNDLYKK